MLMNSPSQISEIKIQEKTQHAYPGTWSAGHNSSGPLSEENRTLQGVWHITKLPYKCEFLSVGKEMLWERSWREPPLPWQGQQADERLVLGAAPWETRKSKVI